MAKNQNCRTCLCAGTKSDVPAEYLWVLKLLHRGQSSSRRDHFIIVDQFRKKTIKVASTWCRVGKSILGRASWLSLTSCLYSTLSRGRNAYRPTAYYSEPFVTNTLLRSWTLTPLAVLEPDLERNLQEGAVEEVLEVSTDGLSSRRLHLFYDDVSVLVQKLVHRLSWN